MSVFVSVLTMAGLVHSIPTDLSRRLKVIGAGQPRTGTTSFTLALQILLGAPVLHSGSACVAREEGYSYSAMPRHPVRRENYPVLTWCHFCRVY